LTKVECRIGYYFGSEPARKTCVSNFFVNEWIIVLIIALPTASWLLGVWYASGWDRARFVRLVDQFDDVTRDPRRQTPKVRMTLYQKLVDRTRRTQKLAVSTLSTPEEEEALRSRKRVFLRFKPLQRQLGAYGSRDRDTDRMASLPDDEEFKITQRMRH